jgi:hypothetical protein
MLERAEELKQRIRETPLDERLDNAKRRIGRMCSEGRPPHMTIPVQYDDDDFYISTTLSDAQATIADLQGQVKASQAERDEQGQLKARLNRDYNLLQNEHLKLHEKVKQEAAYTKQVEIERDALQQRVAQLEGELAAAKAPRVYDCGSYAIGIGLAQRVAQLEGDVEEQKRNYLNACETIYKMYVAATGREGVAPKRGVVEDLADLRADHARVLGLVQETVEFFESNFENAGLELCGLMGGKEITYTGQRLNELIEQLAASLPAQRAKLAQGGV